MNAVWQLFCRDLRLTLRQGSEAATALGFFALAAILFPFGIGPEPELLARIGAGLFWVVALLAALLALERLFAEDYRDGSLDLLLIGPTPPTLLLLAKLAAHWLATGLPMLLLLPALALLFHIDPAVMPVLLAALAIGSLALTAIGAVAAALTLGARRSGLLMPILALPLYIPILILGAGAVEAAAAGLAAGPSLALLGGLTLAALALAPWAATAALKSALSGG